MEEIYITQFQNKFGLSFNDVVNILDIGADTYDDGIYHYINLTNKDVYSFDTDDNIWLEKNLHKLEVLEQLKFYC